MFTISHLVDIEPSRLYDSNGVLLGAEAADLHAQLKHAGMRNIH